MENTVNEVSKKDILLRKSENIYNRIENQLDEIKERSGTIAKTAIVVGGVLFVSYMIYKRFSRKSTSDSVELEGQKVRIAPIERESVIVRMIKEYIAMFLISIAKQKLQEVLKNLNLGESQDTKSHQLQ